MSEIRSGRRLLFEYIRFTIHHEKKDNVNPVDFACKLTINFYFSVCLKWKLHFEFVTATGPITGLDLETGQSGDRMWQGPGQITTETMSWDVPIQVLPTMPIQAENIASSQNVSVLQF